MTLPSSPSPLLDAIYRQSHANEAIELREVKFVANCNGQECRGTALATQRFSPDDRLELVARLTPELIPLLTSDIGGPTWDGKLILTETGVAIETLVISTQRGSDAAQNRIVFTPRQSPMRLTTACDSLVSSVFHLFNFPAFNGNNNYQIVRDEGTIRRSSFCGRIDLYADGWEVMIVESDLTRSATKQLKDVGGYILTHVGRIRRIDGSAFSSNELDAIQRCVQMFLSFALGRWAGLALTSGVDREGVCKFEEWGLPLCASGHWKGHCSWYEPQCGDLLPSVFPGFYSLWNDPTWQPAINESLYWYLASNERSTGIGVDAGIILAQAALERLAWTYCVEKRQLVGHKSFRERGLPASDRLRLLATSLTIPTDIPPQMTALNAKRGEKWPGIPEAITGVRNSIVHPSESKAIPAGSDFEAWNLSMWLLDLVFLRLCQHDGRYSNRLTKRWAGETEPVPWAPTDTVPGRRMDPSKI